MPTRFLDLTSSPGICQIGTLICAVWGDLTKTAALTPYRVWLTREAVYIGAADRLIVGAVAGKLQGAECCAARV